ncbi:MAG: thiamine phosphate synthase, partial [Candidatus Eremiobacteraeota bacterium]|nr:thiamine phosphate synthase [Candidatus Eremiobacteraeota bacterium]
MTARSGDAPRRRLHGIYAILEPDRVDPVAFTDALLAGGIRLVQVRAKRGIAVSVLQAIVARVRAAAGLTLVNDDPQLAQHADGVHLGQEDLALHDLTALRAALGERVIGISAG